MAPGPTQVTWAAGMFGTLLRSPDNGATWTAVNSGTLRNLKDVDFVTPDAGWAVGDGGAIVRIAAGTGSAQMWGTGIHLDAVDAVDATHAWAVGTSGTVIRTVDGATWTATATSPVSPSIDLRAVRFTSATTGWVAGDDNSIYYTDDAGATWQNKGTADTDFDVWDIAVEGSTIWAVGADASWAPKFYVATDGGTFYAPVPPMTTAGGYLTSVKRVDATHVWVTTSAGEALLCTGPGWTEQTTGYEYTWLGDVDFRDTSTGILVGGSGAIARTANGGALWTTRGVDVSSSINSVEFVSTTTGLAVSGSDVWLTKDSGASWEEVPSGSPYNLLSIDMCDADSGWIVGDNGAVVNVAHDDTGYYFGVLSPRFTVRALFDVSMVDGTHAWACGQNGEIFRTTDVDTWTAVADTKTTVSLNGIDFFDTLHGIAVGEAGTILHTEDGGVTWTLGDSGTTASLRAVEMVSATTGFASGDSLNNPYPGIQMYKTTDGGATWSPMTPPAGVAWDHLRGMSFADAQNGWIVGSTGAIFHTTDGGNTWTDEKMTDVWLNGVFALNVTTAWAVGYGDTILTTYVVPPAPYSSVSVYRFFNKQSGTHFYTPSVDEANAVIIKWSNVFDFEGICYTYNGARATKPLWRFYNKKNGSHFYTASDEEKAAIQNRWPDVFSLDGPTYAVCPTQVPNSTPVWRFYNKSNGSHFYTASPEERDIVTSRWGNVYGLDGEAFYLPQ